MRVRHSRFVLRAPALVLAARSSTGRLLSLSLLLLFFGSCASSSPGHSAEEDTRARMERAMSLMGPGEEHGVLGRMVGEWDQTARLQGVPGVDPTETEGTVSGELVLGGRFLRQVTRSRFMDMPWDGVSFFGFDRRREVYTLVGFDTLGTYYITAEGAWDAAAMTLTLSGRDDDPVMGVVKEFTYVITFRDDGSFTTELSFSDELHTRGEADSVTVMTATSTRR